MQLVVLTREKRVRIGSKLSPKVTTSSQKKTHQRSFHGPVLIGIISIILILVTGLLVFCLCKRLKKFKKCLPKTRSQSEANISSPIV